MDSRKGNGPRRSPKQAPSQGRGLGLRAVSGREFELVHPHCVEERRDDYDEGIEARRAGAVDEAVDILRFALEGCGDNAWVHVALGQIALDEQHDPRLARGHFSYVVELARRALASQPSAILPPQRPANAPLYQAIDGLIAVEKAQKRSHEAAALRQLRAKLEGRQHESSIEHTT